MGEWIHRCRQTTTHTFGLPDIGAPVVLNSGYLNNQNQLIAGETLFTGTINRTEVHPREVIKRALYHNAAAVVLAHNHPSGEVTPSKADRLITERLVQALGLVDIRVPDHLIVGGSQVFSFAEHGLL